MPDLSTVGHWRGEIPSDMTLLTSFVCTTGQDSAGAWLGTHSCLQHRLAPLAASRALHAWLARLCSAVFSIYSQHIGTFQSWSVFQNRVTWNWLLVFLFFFFCITTSYSIPEHPSRPFLDRTLCEHFSGLVGRAAKQALRCNTQQVYSTVPEPNVRCWRTLVHIFSWSW